jgi:anti-sigma factor RsiW
MNCEHLSQDLIFRTLDDELTAAERFACESHLAVCEACCQQLAALHEFSIEIEAVVQATPIPSMANVRREVQETVEPQDSRVPALPNPGRVMRRFGWGMGIAATLALGVSMLVPKHDLTPRIDGGEKGNRAPSAQAAIIEVDGESFQPLPYSNDDLATSAPHIVQMQVPISSLADVGIVVEPTGFDTAAVDIAGVDTERSVLADVLVGADGQPRGVHVLE